LFHLGVAKVDLNVAYVAMAMLQVYVPNVSSRRMLQLFNLGVAKVDLNVGVEESQALGGRVAARAVWRLMTYRGGQP
jgi:hypothetical protein